MSKKSCPIFYRRVLYKMRHEFLDIQSVNPMLSMTRHWWCTRDTQWDSSPAPPPALGNHKLRTVGYKGVIRIHLHLRIDGGGAIHSPLSLNQIRHGFISLHYIQDMWNTTIEDDITLNDMIYKAATTQRPGWGTNRADSISLRVCSKIHGIVHKLQIQ